MMANRKYLFLKWNDEHRKPNIIRLYQFKSKLNVMLYEFFDIHRYVSNWFHRLPKKK